MWQNDIEAPTSIHNAKILFDGKFKMQNATYFEADDKLMASILHECAHAAIAHLLGISVNEICINTDSGQPYGGYVRYDIPEWVSTDDEYFTTEQMEYRIKFLIDTASGRTGESLLFGDNYYSEGGDADDRMIMEEANDFVLRKKEFNRLLFMTRTVSTQLVTKYKDTILALSKAIYALLEASKSNVIIVPMSDISYLLSQDIYGSEADIVNSVLTYINANKPYRVNLNNPKTQWLSPQT